MTKDKELEVSNKSILIAKLLEEAQAQQGLSDRALAARANVAHTTIGRLKKGESADLETIDKIASYLGVNTTSLLTAAGIGPDDLAAKIAVILQREPKLAEVFDKALDRVLEGKMQLSTLRDLASYAAFRLNLTDEDDVESA